MIKRFVLKKGVGLLKGFDGVDLYNLVRPHLGKIIGTGHHDIDTENILNFKKYHELLNCILEELEMVVYYSEGSYERSVIAMREQAISIIKETRAWLNDFEIEE